MIATILLFLMKAIVCKNDKISHIKSAISSLSDLY